MTKQVNYKIAYFWITLSWIGFIVAMILLIKMCIAMGHNDYDRVAELILSALGILILSAIPSGYYKFRYNLKKVPIEYVVTKEELERVDNFKKKFLNKKSK